MKLSDLASAIRRDLLKNPMANAESIQALSDEEILDSMRACPRCQAELFADWITAVKMARDAQAFLRAVHVAVLEHQCSEAALAIMSSETETAN